MRADADDIRRTRFGWPVLVGLAGLGVIALAAGIWFGRIPLAEIALRSFLNGKGVESDFRIVRLDWNGAGFTGVRLGAEALPDVMIGAGEVVFDWVGLSPVIRGVSLVEPRIRLRMDQGGRISTGSLENLIGGGGQGGARPTLPRLGLEIEGGQALLDGPLGALTATFSSTGAIGADFTAHAEMAPTTLPGEAYALANGRATLDLRTSDTALIFSLLGGVDALRWAGVETGPTELTLTGQTALDFAGGNIEARLVSGAIEAPGVAARDADVRVTAAAVMASEGIRPAAWQVSVDAGAGRFGFADALLDAAALNMEWEGREGEGDARWSLAAERFQGFTLDSAAPSASGELTFELEGDEQLRASGQVLLTRTRMNENAQANLRRMIPNLGGAPIGPTFAQAERALDSALDRFDLVLPLQVMWREAGPRVSTSAPITARAASGAQAQFAPLRDDQAALALQWPGASLHGNAELSVSGGGLPNLSILFDAIDWAPDAAFEADGVISITDWRADGASIAAEELNFTLTAPPDEEGRLDLEGAVLLTGPVADGQVRGMSTDLDLAITWRNGWRVTPADNCLPVRMQGLDVAGLSFQSGAFRLCAAQGGALIAADAQDRLSGGFVIDALTLNGHLAGENAPPARIATSRVTGRFSGTSGDMLTAIEAAAPTLNIDFAEDRRLSLALARVTANARTHDGSWDVEGAFDAGELDDPTLPGTVSAIAGRWTAAPEGDEAVIRVDAGAARIVARESEDSRPLFNPLRILNATAIMRGGQINGEGDLLLEEGARGVARVVAEHDIAEGVGTARLSAEALVFNQDLQPFELSELARGVVENVAGPASMDADIRWTPDAVTATGRFRPQGMSFATATIPVVENVTGEIYFDDLFLLTTPPGQVLRAALVNPGVPVRNGVLQFQLARDGRVSIEGAHFDFASGILSVEPTTITLGAEETRLVMHLRDVDVAEFLAQMAIPDLTATGTVEGTFPMRLTNRTAYIEGGVLRASPEGGTIAYTGSAGESATGPARLAFQALTSFRYDELSLTLDGDLSDELVTAIEFSGENTGDNLEVISGTGIPGIGDVTVQGVPFAFNVRVTAPFRRLADTVRGVTDAGAVLDQAIRDQQEEAEQGESEELEPPPVDQTPP